MTIKITKTPDGYLADVTPPHGGGAPWALPNPLPADDLVQALLNHGCNQSEIGEAFFAADPDWLDASDQRSDGSE